MNRPLFVGAATKRLSVVDITPRSNQHELAAGRLRPLLIRTGVVKDAPEPAAVAARVVLLEDDAEPLVGTDTLTLYDARTDKADRSSEWRAYYPSGGEAEALLRMMAVGDTIMFAVDRDGRVLLLLAPADSQWHRVLTGVTGAAVVDQLRLTDDEELARRQAQSPMDLLAAALDIDVADEDDEAWLIHRLGHLSDVGLPSTGDMAELAWARVGTAPDDPDVALVEWLEAETRLFAVLEDAEATPRIAACTSLEEHLKVAKSILNRRRSRRGYSLEHHMARILDVNGIGYEAQVATEPGSRSDFIIPDLVAYRGRDPNSHAIHLGAKSTARERWKQLLSEAVRLDRKHLVTLDMGLSPKVRDAMTASGVTLVMPGPLGGLYDDGRILDVTAFLGRCAALT